MNRVVHQTMDNESLEPKQSKNDNKTVKTYADDFVSFKKLKEKTWDDVDINQYQPININEKLNYAINKKGFDSSILSMPIGDWMMPVYVELFNTQPNKIRINPESIKIRNFFTDLLDKFKFKNDYHLRSETFFSGNNNEIDIDNEQVLVCLDKHGLIIYKSYELLNIYYSPDHYLTNEGQYKLKSLLSVAKSYSKERIQKNHISIIYNDGNGLSKNIFELKKKEINLEENYNDDFIQVSKDIIHKLNNRKKTGLFILHGEHGTGKTTYIRYLASILEREVIFVPPDMVDIITSPNFIGFLMDNPDSVLIIEDGESAVQQRDNIRTNGVANILNMTDGLLSDCLNISIVVTFNTKTKNLDDALLRKGRLLRRYEFGKLTQTKAQKLLEKIGSDKTATGPMRLSDIYYADDDNQQEDFSEKKNIKGFNK